MAKIKTETVNRTGMTFLAAASNQEFAVGALPESVDDEGLIERFSALIGVAGELRADGQSWLDHRAARPAVADMVAHGIQSRTMQISLLRQEADARELADGVLMDIHANQRAADTTLSQAARHKRQELLDEFVQQGYTDTTPFKQATRNHVAVRQLRGEAEQASQASRKAWGHASHHRGNAKWCRDKAEKLYRDIISGDNLAAAVYREPTGNPGEYDDRQDREEKRTRHFKARA